MLSLGSVDVRRVEPVERTMVELAGRPDDGSIAWSGASRYATRYSKLYRRRVEILVSWPAGTAHIVCGPPRGDLELSDSLRHCLDE
jgi:hypothetical protein